MRFLLQLSTIMRSVPKRMLSDWKSPSWIEQQKVGKKRYRGVFVLHSKPQRGGGGKAGASGVCHLDDCSSLNKITGILEMHLNALQFLVLRYICQRTSEVDLIIQRQQLYLLGDLRVLTKLQNANK